MVISVTVNLNHTTAACSFGGPQWMGVETVYVLVTGLQWARIWHSTRARTSLNVALPGLVRLLRPLVKKQSGPDTYKPHSPHRAHLGRKTETECHTVLSYRNLHDPEYPRASKSRNTTKIWVSRNSNQTPKK